MARDAWFYKQVRYGREAELATANHIRETYDYQVEDVAEQHLTYDLVLSMPDTDEVLKIDVKHANTAYDITFKQDVIKRSEADVYCYYDDGIYLIVDVEALRTLPTTYYETLINQENQPYCSVPFFKLKQWCEINNYRFQYI